MAGGHHPPLPQQSPTTLNGKQHTRMVECPVGLESMKMDLGTSLMQLTLKSSLGLPLPYRIDLRPRLTPQSMQTNLLSIG